MHPKVIAGLLKVIVGLLKVIAGALHHLIDRALVTDEAVPDLQCTADRVLVHDLSGCGGRLEVEGRATGGRLELVVRLGGGWGSAKGAAAKRWAPSLRWPRSNLIQARLQVGEKG